MKTSTKLGAYPTAEQALKGADLSGKTVLITGGNSGIGNCSLNGDQWVNFLGDLQQHEQKDFCSGTETARVLALAGARVIITSRQIAAGQEVAGIIQKQEVKVSLHIANVHVRRQKKCSIAQ